MASILEKKLEEVEGLKSEWGIGSGDAFSYMKAEEYMNKLADVARAKLLDEGIDARPTYRVVSNLCDYAYRFFSAFLDECINYSDDLGEHFYVGHPLSMIDREFAEGRIAARRIDLDFEEFVCDFYAGMENSEDYDEPFKQAFVNSYEDVLEREPSLKPANILSRILRLEKNEDFDSENWRRMQYAKEQSLVLLEWMGGRIPELPFNLEKFDWGGKTFEEATYLFGEMLLGNSLYERARKDRTLGDIWVERKVALQSILSLGIDGDSEAKLEQSVDLFKGRMGERVRKLELRRSQTEILNRDWFVDRAENELRENQYRLRVIQLHKKWLSEVLDR